MRRLIVTGPRQATFEDVARPKCPPDGLVVRARVTAISVGTEIRVFRAKPVDDAGRFLHERIPFVLPTENGYSMVGDVVEVGSDVDNFVVGERVYTSSAHKEFAAVHCEMAVKLPDSIPDEQAVFLNILEVGHIALRRGSPAPGENVAVVGQGVIGLAALSYCHAFGFRTVAIDISEERLAVSRRMGAGIAISPASQAYGDHLHEFFDGAGADLVIEAASRWDAIRVAMEVAADEAKIVVAARHTDLPEFNPVGHPYLGKKLTLLTSYGHAPPGQRWDRRRSIALTLDLMSRGHLDVTPMITHRIDAESIPDMYGRLEAGEPAIVGVVARWSS